MQLSECGEMFVTLEIFKPQVCTEKLALNFKSVIVFPKIISKKKCWFLHFPFVPQKHYSCSCNTSFDFSLKKILIHK